MIFKDENDRDSDGLFRKFPDALWFTVLIFVACVIATVIYSFTYVSEVSQLFDKDRAPINFVDGESVTIISWALFIFSILLLFFASAIRNAMYSRAPRIMREDTEDYVEALKEAEANQAPAAPAADAQAFAEKLRAAQERQK